MVRVTPKMNFEHIQTQIIHFTWQNLFLNLCVVPLPAPCAKYMVYTREKGQVLGVGN